MNKKILIHQSFGHAIRGIGCLIMSERNMQIHLASAAFVIALGLCSHLSASEWMLIIVAISGVLTAEAMNTAIERCVDLASPQWNVLAKEAKDIAAGAVLLASIGAGIIGLIIFLPKFTKGFSIF